MSAGELLEEDDSEHYVGAISEEGSDSWNCSNCWGYCICGGSDEESEDGGNEDDNVEESYEEDIEEYCEEDDEEYSEEDDKEECSQDDDKEEYYEEDDGEEGHYVGAICEEVDTGSEDSEDQQWSGSGDAGSSGKPRYRHRRHGGKNKVAPSLPSLPLNSSVPSLSLPIAVQIVEDWTRQMKHQLPSFFGT